jgi:hypothetical protein
MVAAVAVERWICVVIDDIDIVGAIGVAPKVECNAGHHCHGETQMKS